MDKLNLNIDNYSLDDLRQLFRMNENDESYIHVDEILSKKEKIEEQLKLNSSISSTKKMDILLFLDTACNKLTEHINDINGINNNDINGTWNQKENELQQINNNMVIIDHNEIKGKQSSITEGRETESKDNPPGWLNPINIRSINTAVNIDSRFRENYYNTNSSDYVVHLPYIQKKTVRLRVASMDIPTTFYSISRKRGDSTSVIVLDGSYSIPSSTWLSLHDLSNPIVINNFIPQRLAWLLVLPDGNYELWQDESKASNLISAMNNSISLAIPGAIDENGRFGALQNPIASDYLNPSNDIAFSVHKHDGRSVFAIPSTTDGDGRFENNSFLINFSVDHAGNQDLNTNIQLRLGWHLGFRVGHYLSKIKGSIISEGICMPTAPRYAFLSIDDGKHNSEGTFINAFSESYIDNNIISKINISSIMNDASVYKPISISGSYSHVNRTREYFGPVDIQRLHIRLIDEYGRVIDLNHMDWSFTLLFEKLYS